MRILFLSIVAFLWSLSPGAGAPAYARLPGGAFVSILAGPDGGPTHASIAPFSMRTEPVTNAEFAAFLRSQPEWRRDRIASLLAGPRYLDRWRAADDPGPALKPEAPVTDVSWFAARAYCASEEAELPTWLQWEYAAAADAARNDARADPARNTEILAAITSASGHAPDPVGARPPNAYGIRDINRLLWEWTEDYAALFSNDDPRVGGSGATLALCGGSALAFYDRTQFAALMRAAALSSLKPRDSSPQVGFRCIRPFGGVK